MDKRQHGRRNELGPDQVHRLLRHKAFHHLRGGGRRQRIDADVVALAFQTQRLHESDHGHLGGAVVGLAEIAENAGRRAGHDDPAIVLGPHDLPDRLRRNDRTHDMDIQDQAEGVQIHLAETLVAQDAGVVH
ncbi:hypothetical protein D3C80_1748730 [compost metagenome]